MTLVKENGLFCIAIYNKARTSKLWKKIKKLYNISPNLGKKLMIFLYFTVMYFIYPLILLKNPFKYYKDYETRRGMRPLNDITDWLGGYPYEFASFNEIRDYVKNIDTSFQLIKYRKVRGNMNNTFLFKKI